MVKLSQLRQHAIPMGQTSSQVDPVKDSKSDGLDANSEKSKRLRRGRKNAKRRSKVSEESADLDEESARVLLQLRGDAANHARMTPTRDDGLAASAQLWAESSPASRPASNGVEIEMAEVLPKPGDVQQDEQGRKKRKKKKRKRLEFEASQHEVENSQFTGDDITERPSKQARSHDSTSTTNYRPSLTQSMLSLDDIPTDDETIAAHLQEYEKAFPIPTPPNSMQLRAIESESRTQQTAATANRGGFISPVQPDYQLPWRSVGSSGRCEKEKSKRRTRSHRIPESSGGGQEEMNGLGQHASATDHEEFDEEFETRQYGSATLSDDLADYEFPIDPDLIQDSPIPASVEEDVMASSEKDVFQRPSHEERSKKVSSSSRKRKEAKNPQCVNPFDLPYTRSEDLSGSRRKAVAPAIEGSIQDSTPITDSFRISSAESERSALQNTRRESEKIPPPLARACKPRGNKTQQGGQRGKHYDPPLHQIAQKGGVFTESEILKLDSFRDSYCQKNELTQRQFNELVQSNGRKNPDATNLWKEVHEITPYRTRMSTMRFCRRRYHNFSARGTWTQSEDESLRLAVAEKGRAWKAVGEMIERFPEDCRDRYRNYHVNSEHRNREEWTQSEVRNLCSAVYACMRMMKEERKRLREEKFSGRDVPESESESNEEIQEMKLINWQAVSDRMGPAGGARSRLQCSFKWGRMKMADRNRYLKEVRAAARAKPPTQKGKSGQTNRQWRLKRALIKIRNMKTGDRYDLLQALSTCGAMEEADIPYRLLGDKAFRSRWGTVERKAAWQKFKEEVPGANRMDYRDVVNRLLTPLMTESAEKLEERWDPKRDGDVNVGQKRRHLTENEKKNREKLRQEERDRRLNIKSQALVHSTDEDEDHVTSKKKPAGVNVIEGSVEEKGSLAASSAAATDDALEESSNGNVGTEIHGSASSEIEDSDDGGLFVDSQWTGNISEEEELAS